MQPSDPQQALAEIAERLGNPPRKFDRRTANYLRMPVNPGWDATEYLADADLLLEKGNAVWAAVVMANRSLFEHRADGNPDMPGVVVFCPDLRSSITPAELLRIAGALFRLYRDGTDDPDLKEVTDLLKQDTRPMKAHPVPAKLSPVYRCLVSSLLYKRDHFPLQTLDGDVVPVLYHPQGNGIVRMVPSRFWPREMIAGWKEKSEKKVPKPTFFSRFLAVPTVLFSIKVTIFCLAMLWLAPSTWTFVRQSEPLPQIETSGLGGMREGTVFRFTGDLDRSGMLETKRKSYIPVDGTDGKVWLQHWKTGGSAPDAVENRVSVLEASSWLDSDLEKHVRQQAGGSGTWPVMLLRSSPAPTIGMKSYRVGLIVVSLLILWGIGRWLLRMLRA